ncbi:hypothetical protein HYR69_08145 [Candidatus Sumerlaeota bacterium]|nr:hypothetical protein [Candidatus Sumerlaeota bacterium]
MRLANRSPFTRGAMLALLALLALSLMGCWSVISTHGRDFLHTSPVKPKSERKVATPMSLSEQEALLGKPKTSPTIVAHRWVDEHLHVGTTAFDDLVLLIGEPKKTKFKDRNVVAEWEFETEWDKGYYWITTSKRSGKGTVKYNLEVTFSPKGELLSPDANPHPSGSPIEPAKFLTTVAAAKPVPMEAAEANDNTFLIKTYTLEFEYRSSHEHDFNPVKGAGKSAGKGVKTAVSAIKP